MRPEHHGEGERARKATGTWLFLTDQLATRPDAWFVHIVRSPYPAATLDSFDTELAMTHPAVRAVFSADDLPDTKYNSAAAPPAAVLSATADQTVLTSSPRHVGDGCVAIVLTEPEAAVEAERLLGCRWTPGEWTGASDLTTARRLGAIRSKEPLGDLPAGDQEFRVTAATSAVEHLCLEGPVCLVDPLPGGGLDIHTNCQAPSDVRRLIADVTGVAMPTIRVIKHQEGGGFGGKQEVFEELLLALLAPRLNHPLWTMRDIRTTLRAGRTRHQARVTATVRADGEGRFTAIDTEAELNSGAYASHVGHVMGDLSTAARLLYPGPSSHFRIGARFTNQIPGGAFRGYGAPQALLAFEQAVDDVARARGLSPFEIRRRNAVSHELLGNPTGPESRLRLLVDLAETRWQRTTPPPPAPGTLRGVGVAACAMLSTTGVPVPDATMTLVRLNEDGTVEVLTGSCDCGTGSSATIGRLVAGELGLAAERVHVREGDTALVVTDLGSFAQRTLYVAGTSALRAAKALRANVITAASRQLGLPADDLSLAAGDVVASDGTPLRTLASVARQETVDGRSLVVTDAADASVLPLSYAVTVIAVDVNPGNGDVHPRHALLAADCGTVINAVAVRGQLEGAFVQGLSAALVERWQMDDTGAVPTSLAEHGSLGPQSLPELDIVLLDQPEPGGPGGAKGVGELGLPPVAAAVANAVFDATGRRVSGIPVQRCELAVSRA